MAISDDIAAIRADNARSSRQKAVDIYTLKVAALRDAILNGKPAPNPIPPLLDRTFTLNGTTITVNGCSLFNRLATDGTVVPQLYIRVTLTRAPLAPVTHDVFYTNPPVLPRSPTGNERQDLIQCASELLAQLPVA
jgi:hypothetical protein